MEINLLQSEGLSRIFAIRVPQETLSERFDRYMEELRPQLNLRGFRPGKVPLSHAKRVYRSSVMKDVVTEYKNAANQQALDNSNLKPATQFDMQDESDLEEVYAGKSDLIYQAACEILPTFKPAEIATMDIEKPVFKYDDKFLAAYGEAYVADMLGEKTERGADEVVEAGDTVELEFSVSVDGTPIKELQTQSQKVVAGEMPGLFDLPKELIGMKVGETKSIPKIYPEHFIFPQMAGKDSEIILTAKKIEYFAVKPYDEAAAKEFFGEDDLPKVKENVVNNFKALLDNIEYEDTKILILNKLDVAHDFLLPEGMVIHELGAIMEQLGNEMRAGNLADEDYLKTAEEIEQEYRKIAERRVRLGLVLAEIGKADNVEVSEREVFEYHAMQQRMNQEQVDKMVKAAREDNLLMSQLRAPLYEERVVEHIKKMARVEDVEVEVAAVIGDKDHKFHAMIREHIPKSYALNK